jgi:hypothetical protein
MPYCYLKTAPLVHLAMAALGMLGATDADKFAAWAALHSRLDEINGAGWLSMRPGEKECIVSALKLKFESVA